MEIKFFLMRFKSAVLIRNLIYFVIEYFWDTGRTGNFLINRKILQK